MNQYIKQLILNFHNFNAICRLFEKPFRHRRSKGWASGAVPTPEWSGAPPRILDFTL